MKSKIHAIAGVIAFLCALAFWISTLSSQLIGTDQSIAIVKDWIFKGLALLIPALLAAGGSGVSLLGKRSDSLALKKQKRGPIAFMTSLFVLLPSSYFSSTWAGSNSFGTLFYGVQAIFMVACSLVVVMVGLNIRDGLALRGRISARGAVSPSIEERDGGPLVVMSLPILNNSAGENLNPKSTTALCRCGASKTKPYCDGSHNFNGFDSHPSDDRTKDEVTVPR